MKAEVNKFKDAMTGIYEKMKTFPAEYGFHFSYSPESCWRPDTKFLILTLNPQARDTMGQLVKIVPSAPWPANNDFFDAANTFRLKRPVQAICYELSRLVDEPAYKTMSHQDAARNFVDDHAIIASFVPFRTENASQIDKPMLDFAKNDYWGEIFKVWLPEVIVTLGHLPFAGMREILSAKCTLVDEGATPVGNGNKKGSLQYRHAVYKSSNGKTIVIAGLPHPAARGSKGWPRDFPAHAGEDSQCRQFLKRMFTH